jgi:hypothetical protein
MAYLTRKTINSFIKQLNSMRLILTVSTVVILFLVSCGSGKKIIKFPTVPDETYANPNLRDFFKSNRNPNIVLRVPNNNDKATSNTSTSKNNDVLITR